MNAPAKHTPGPWHILRSTYAAKQHHAVEVNDKSGQTVAYSLNFVARFKDEGEANAHLIAAAPELLEALEEATESECRSWCEQGGPHRPSCDKRRALIAKARGEA